MFLDIIRLLFRKKQCVSINDLRCVKHHKRGVDVSMLMNNTAENSKCIRHVCFNSTSVLRCTAVTSGGLKVMFIFHL